MLAAIVGDIVGSVYECWGNAIKTPDFPLSSDYSHWTDDTVLTMTVADTLLSGRSHSETIRAYTLVHPHSGYGHQFKQWFTAPGAGPYNSFGNGSAMALRMSNNSTATTYTLTVNVTGSGSVAKSPDAASYASGTVVTLTAAPAPGFTFTNWSGDLSGTTSPTTITMTGNKTVTAVFALTTTSYTLSLLPSWNVISVPFPTLVSSLTTCDLVLTWDGSLWQSVTTLLPGTGYLVRNTVGATTVTLTGLPSSSPQTQPATGTWQIIGNPYTTPASFACTSSVPYLLTWDGSFWQLASPTNLPPGLGFLLQASSPGTITLTRLP
jgi:uncharacterized repeat protein (TIGR02543 family)